MNSKTKPRIELSKTDIMVDEEFRIRITNLTQGETIKLSAETKDDDGVIWNSNIELKTDENSSVELEGIDPEGLFTRMRPRQPSNKNYIPIFEKRNIEPLSFTISFESNSGSRVAKLKRRFLPKNDFTRVSVNEGKLIGTLFYPEADGPHPVIIFISGSAGKFNEPRAALLASKGVAVFSVAYFGIDPLPEELIEVPLEFFDLAVTYLKKQPLIDTDRLGIFGFSKGGELALLLASREPIIKAVVAYAPSSYVWQGLSKKGELKSSWSYNGKPLPFVPMDVTPKMFSKLTSGKPIAFREAYERGLHKYPKDAEAARILVEKIKAPVLITSGGDDAIWPADQFAKDIEERIGRAGGNVIHFNDKFAGHLTTQAFLPAAQTMENLLFGGEADISASVLAKAWPETILLFKDNL